MNEKRRYTRFSCLMKVHFDYYDGDPDTIDVNRDKSKSGKGHILDISRGGIFIATNSRVSVNMPVRVEFRTAKRKMKLEGAVVRTGLMKNNPSEVACRFSELDVREDAYLAIEFNELIDVDPLELEPGQNL